MSLLDAVISTGPIPPDTALQSVKKRYSGVLSRNLAVEGADGLHRQRFPDVRPMRNGPGERTFQGGLGPKRVDMSYADASHVLLLAVSIKSINFAPFGKNLKNRFADLCTEAITLHMRFPYPVVTALFAFPATSDEINAAGKSVPTFQRATRLFKPISGRENYTDPGEKFENITMFLFQPLIENGPDPWIRLVNVDTGTTLSKTLSSCYYEKSITKEILTQSLGSLQIPTNSSIVTHTAIGDE